MSPAPDGAADTHRSEPTPERGRTTVTPRALNGLARAVTADTFGVKAQAVQVDLSDQGGLLALSIRTPIRVIALNTIRPPDTVAATSTSITDGSVLYRVAAAQTTIRERVTALTGAEVVHVTIRVNGIDTEEERRVT